MLSGTKRKKQKIKILGITWSNYVGSLNADIINTPIN